MIVVITVVGALIVLGILVWMFIEYNRQEDPENYPICHNYMKQYTGGHFEGTIIEQKEYSDRTKVTFLPKDIDFRKLEKENKKIRIKPYTIWVENDKMERMPKGGQSDHRDFIDLLPPRSEDISEDLKKTPKGQFYMNHIENKNANRLESEVQRQAKETIAEMYKTNNLGEISPEFLRKQKVYQDTSIQMLFDKEKQNRNNNSPTEPPKFQGGN